MAIQEGDKLPEATLHMMVDGKPTAVTTAELFGGKKVVVFAVPGAYTPTCSQAHLPGFVVHADDILGKGVDSIVCLSVNDAFVMAHWARSRQIEKVVMLPDGNAEFTRKMGMLVDRSAQGMGMRSWRYSMLVEDSRIAQLFAEPGFCDNPPGVPLERASAQVMLSFLQERA